jgi:FtsJ-like methyltransferase
MGFGAVLSDMAPSTSGIAASDAAQSLDLAQYAADLALGGPDRLLAPRGNLVVKLLEVKHFCASRAVRQHGIIWWTNHSKEVVAAATKGRPGTVISGRRA